MQALQKQVGERIKELRAQKGLSQEALAGICNLHRTYVGLIERGERNLTLTTIDVLATGLGVPVAHLFDGLPPSPRIASPKVSSAPDDIPAHLATIRQILINASLTDQKEYDALFKKNRRKEGK